MKVNIHIYPSDLSNAARMMKETNSIRKIDYFDEIVLIGIYKKNLLEYDELDSYRKIWRVKTFFKHRISSSSLVKALFFIEFQGRIFLKYRNLAQMVNIHTLSLLPLGWLFKVFNKTIFVYDTHELESQRPNWGKVKSKIAIFIEKKIIKRCDLLITVNNSISQWYVSKYKVSNFLVLRNIPERGIAENFDKKYFHKKYNIPDNDIIFIFQGILVEGRCIKKIMEVFNCLDSNKHIIFMGSGSLKKCIIRNSEKCKYIHYHNPVKPSDVVRYVSFADIGFSLIENKCKNNYYALPNKFFECLVAEIPVIVSDLPEMENVINSYNCGIVVKKLSVDSIRNVVESVDIRTILSLKENVKNNCQHLSWENEEKKLIDKYRKIIECDK